MVDTATIPVVDDSVKPSTPAGEATEKGNVYKFSVAMSCGGCSGAVDRVLKKLEGVKSYEVSLERQEAVVVAEPTLSKQTVFDTIAKTGKKVTEKADA